MSNNMKKSGAISRFAAIPILYTFFVMGFCDIVGGAVIPPLMGLMSDILGTQVGSLLVIGLCRPICYSAQLV